MLKWITRVVKGKSYTLFMKKKSILLFLVIYSNKYSGLVYGSFIYFFNTT